MSVVVEPIIDDELQCLGAIDVEDEEHLIVDDEVNGQDIEVVQKCHEVAKRKRSCLQGDVDHQAQQGDRQHDLEHTDDHGHHLQQGDMSHHSKHGDVGERGTENRIFLKVEGNNFNPSGASRQLVNIIKKSFSGAWVTWGKIPNMLLIVGLMNSSCQSLLSKEQVTSAWIEAAGGVTKGRLYGLGSDNTTFVCGRDHTSMSTSTSTPTTHNFDSSDFKRQ
ncbi:uncharacterized protein G2W53_044717 [Senna tora]|uniref:Uncharacterized protein n=1 Tax=Senna tora TaxID=362788 RepID=A0A834SDE1_9FABA|nr:uncharacterized protein G2W53_044717 [Senna tora]